MNSHIKWQADLFKYFNSDIIDSLTKLSVSVFNNINEIRFSSGGFVSVSVKSDNLILKNARGEPIKFTLDEMNKMCSKLFDGTMYKFENQIKNGYITITGGHRVGFCGTAVYNSDNIVTVKNITSMSFRISRQIKNAAREVIGNIMSDGIVCSALIVSEPCGGKTTILTDLARLISNSGKRCAVIDERGEICSVYNGVPHKDIGKLTYVFDGYSKRDGMMIALRSMSPQVIICDEIGSTHDVQAMLDAMNAGVPVIATAHASDEDELFSRPQIEKMINYGAIDKIIFLKGASAPGAVKKVLTVNEYDEDYWNSDDID